MIFNFWSFFILNNFPHSKPFGGQCTLCYQKKNIKREARFRRPWSPWDHPQTCWSAENLMTRITLEFKAREFLNYLKSRLGEFSLIPNMNLEFSISITWGIIWPRITERFGKKSRKHSHLCNSRFVLDTCSSKNIVFGWFPLQYRW